MKSLKAISKIRGSGVSGTGAGLAICPRPKTSDAETAQARKIRFVIHKSQRIHNNTT